MKSRSPISRAWRRRILDRLLAAEYEAQECGDKQRRTAYFDARKLMLTPKTMQLRLWRY